MSKFIKSFINNVYKTFLVIFIIINIIFIALIKSKIYNIQKSNSELYFQLNHIFLLMFLFSIISIGMCIAFIYILKFKIVNFSNNLSQIIDDIINEKKEIIFNTDEETLMSKLENKLKNLIEVMNYKNQQYLNEKDNIKSLIADISHQIKTPIANILMYNDTLIERDLKPEEEKLFLNNMKFQINKLDWLVQSLIKMSRLENGVISLNKIYFNLNDTIADALSGIYLKALKKDIEISVECDNDIYLNCDPKWTSEAFFNILENAVKYSKVGGKINIQIEKRDIFTVIDIIDNGIGIDSKDINNIFKRFYRATEVNEIEGIGIGLYLAREILTKEGGYIKVKSKKNEGSTFSIFLLNS